MPKPIIAQDSGRQAVRDVLANLETAPREKTALAVRYLLQVLATTLPGNSVEVRIPPYGAIQCIQGPDHTRGTPANVVEMSSLNWVKVATGEISWEELASAGLISASGIRSDLGSQLPLAQW